MRRKLLLLCLLLCSIIGFWACGSSPYENMSLVVYCNDTALKDGEVINLNIKKSTDGTYNYEQVVLLVQVDDDDAETDRGVSISDGQGFVTTTAQFDPRTGLTSVIVKANSFANTGKFSLRITTNEGNISKLVNFNIDLALENFDFKEDALKVVGKGGTLSLKNVDDFIEFYPAETTQRDIKLEVAPLEVAGDGVTHFVEGWVDGGNFAYLNDGKQYASLVDGVLSTFDTYRNEAGVPTKIAYPTRTISASMGGESVQQEVVILKASFYFAQEKEYLDRFIVIPVIEPCEEIEVNMNAQRGDSSEFILPVSESGEYEIVLIDPSFEDSIFTSSLEYYIERELNFYLSENFHVEADPTADGLPVLLVPETGKNHFKVHAMKSGIYKHEFRIVHNEYPHLFDQRVTVKFIVQDLPTDILINGSQSTPYFTIYDFYANSKGQRIDVDLNTKVGDYKYYVFCRDYEDILNVNLNTARSTENLVFANFSPATSLLSSTVEGKNYTKFNPTDSFYLSHSFTTLPSTSVPLGVGVSINLCGESYYSVYTESELGAAFYNLLMSKTFYVTFEMGLRSFEFVNKDFHIDLTNSDYIEGSDPSKGVVLCTLPEGQNIESCISTLEYDKSLITITEYTPNERHACTSIIAKCNDDRKEGMTKVRMVAKNGVVGNVNITTYMPTIYSHHTPEAPVPISITVNEKSSGYLYRVSGRSDYEDYAAHSDMLIMSNNMGILGSYDSVKTLFGIVGKTIDISFYDFTYIDNILEPYDITNKVRISFNNDGYVTYNNGVLSLHRLVVDKATPIIMTVRYTGGYETLDGDNNPVYAEVIVEHQVYIYIYNPLQGVNILSEKSANLYVYDSLSYFDRTEPEQGSSATRDLSKNLIRASFSPSENNLGAIWNTQFGDYQPLTLWYDCRMLNEAVKDKNGRPVVIQSNLSGADYELTYGDLFEVIPASVPETLIYTCEVRCKLSIELIEWIEAYYGGISPLNYKIQSFLDNYIMGKDYSIVVNVYANQFERLTNINTLNYTCCYASKINSLKLNIDDDGVYFDIRDGQQHKVIEYTIDNADCINKEMIIIGGTTNHYITTIEYGSGATGKIIIDTYDNMLNGELYELTIIPKDNVSNYSLASGYTFYNDALNQTIRVKVADGSKALPFEIKSNIDLKDMFADIEAANTALPTDTKSRYYYYVLARDLNLYGEVLPILDVLKQDKGIFSLSGKHTYSRNGEEISTYNRIYNLNINKVLNRVSNEMFIGLFGKIGKAVSIDNLAILNSRISLASSTDIVDSNNIHVGILAGRIEGSDITSLSVSGSIRTQMTAPNVSLFIGGMVGSDTADGGSIKNRPESAIAGMAATSNNVMIEIDLGGTIDSQVVGGVIGKLTTLNVQTLQVVSTIRSKVIANTENIGGVVGIMDADGKTISGLQVSPVIAVETRGSEVGNFGGVIGQLNAGALTNSKVYFVNLGDDYSQKEKINIYVTGMVETNVGGLVGVLSGDEDKTIRYSYVRSFYNSDIKKGNYAGNIVVTNCEEASVGGIAGALVANAAKNSSAIVVMSSYYDGDIMVDATKQIEITDDETLETNIYPASTGLLFGSVGMGLITNSYGVGKLYYNLTTKTTDSREDPAVVSETVEFVASTTIEPVNGFVGGFEYLLPNDELLGVAYSSAIVNDIIFNDVYAVVNDLGHYIANASVVSYIDSMQKIIDDAVAADTLSLFRKLGYQLTTGEQDGSMTAQDYAWFYHEKINLAGGNAYPILLSANGLAMYDLVPTGIGIIVNEENKNVFDISYTDELTVRHNQMIMFVKKTAQGVYSEDFYEIMVENSEGSDKATIKVTFNGETIDTYLVDIEIDDQIEILLKNNNSVLELVNNRVYPRKEGVATIEIRSYLDKTIKTSITVKVINSVDTIKMYDIVDTNKIEMIPEIPAGTNDNRRIVYIDELSNFEIAAIDSEGYLSTKDIGYILEILPYDAAEPLANNGAIKLDGKLYKYIDGDNNTYLLDGDSVMKATGETIGYVRFKLTPYLKLADIYHEDVYTTANGTEISFQNAEKTGTNVYILNKAKLDIANEYVIIVNARAIGVDNDTKTAGISSKNGFEIISTVETSNVIMNDFGGGDVRYSLLEDVYLDVGLSGSKINYANLKIIELEGLSVPVDETYYFNDGTNITPYLFKYELINIYVHGFDIESTDVNVDSRPNTYKIFIKMTVTFDKEFYRANANKYDLNSVKFDINVIPHSNFMLDAVNGYAPYALKNSAVIDTTLVKITPASLTDIFMNYYTRGEGLLGNTENTYPNDNESNFIVPGRDGLLKITLAEEFNNSSYVTVTLDKKYAGYVKLEQMAGVMVGAGDGSATEFNDYASLDFVDPVETSDYFGLRLQKLTCNSSTESYFNNTYYVKVTLAQATDYSDFISPDPQYDYNPVVEIKVTSYTIQTDGNVKETLDEPKYKVLTIAELPSLIAQIDGSSTLYMGVGVKKAIDIRYKGLTNDIMLSSSSEYLFVVDDTGERVASLSIEYLDEGRIYYLCLAVDAYSELDTVDIYTLTMTGEEYVWGVLETTKAELWISPVEFEISGVTLQDSNYNPETGETELTINHGQSVILRLNFEYADIEVALDTELDANGKNRLIQEHIARLETYYKYGNVGETFSPKQLVEYAIAGTTVTEIVGGVETILTRGILNLYKVTYRGNEEVLTSISNVGVHGGIEILTDIYRSSYDPDNIDPVIEILYTLLRGVSISSDSLLRMSVPYHYEEGRAVPGPSNNGIYYDDYIQFRVVVKDNSSDTHPTPIENQADLKAYAGTTGHYILVNNIVLEEWEPIPVSFDSLDGNGYSIIIKSFNMSNIRTTTDVNAGIFTTVGVNTLLKNLIIDVSHILTDETTMINNANIVNNSTADKYVHDQAGVIDLTFVTTLNFGILAGTNEGSITNAKVVNTKAFNTAVSTNKYLHVLTSQIDKDGNLTTSNIGGLVGVNATTGAISNSFLGTNISNQQVVTVAPSVTELRSYITTVTSPDSIEYHNRYDEMTEVQVHPFVIAGANNIAGVAMRNDGTISNTYAKGLGVYNTYPAVTNSITAGLVGTNNNIITSCFVEGAEIVDYRATGRYPGETDRKDTIEAIGNVGGLVFTNNKTIKNSYANVYLETQSSFIAGFVFTNNGNISSSYSTSVNRNNLAYGQFTGVLQRVVQNFGTYDNCYYLVDIGEEKNEKEAATPVYIEFFDASQTSQLSDFWSGFSFASQSGANEEDGIWTIRDGLPKIVTTLTDTNSFRILDQIEEISDEDGIIQFQQYSYLYDSAYQEGTKGNPLVIESAKYFDAKIINRGRAVGSEYIFGAVSSRDILDIISAVEYVRLVNNLDFSSITTSNKVEGKYLYETIFAGKLDGNGMSMNNLHIDTDSTQLENFGIFKQVGVDTSMSTSQTVIKNLTMTLSSYNSNNNSRAGVLAGTIRNATITNVAINGNGVSISATNMAGALAGVIIADGQSKVSIVDVLIENITVSAEYSSIGGEIDGFTTDESFGRYKTFNILNRENNTRDSKSFASLKIETDVNNVVSIKDANKVSYAGAVAGVLIANNLDDLAKNSIDINDYRTLSSACSIDNILVKNAITIKTADNAGGLFGYLSENSRIKNCKFELGSSVQLIKSWNFAGGIVGENHGVIEQCFVAHAEAEQDELDATITNNVDRDNGTINLFSMSDGNFYNVAVGGIAGYSKNGAIIDSYTKANVIQPLAFIAGGVVGYADGSNYIGFTYSTGAVYARTVMGGVVGLQVSEEYSLSSDILYMNTVVGLNDWQTYRDNISLILYNNYKSLYVNETGYDNFYLKMPEVGNQNIDLFLTYNVVGSDKYVNGYEESHLEDYNLDIAQLETFYLTGVTIDQMDANTDGQVSNDERQAYLKEQVLGVVGSLSTAEYEKKLKEKYISEHIYNIPEKYTISHSKVYVGSVVGLSYIFPTSSDEDREEFLYSSDLDALYANQNNINHVFSSTYGLYSQEGKGTLENGDRNDTYFGETFDLSVGAEQNAKLYSYRIPYLDSDIEYNDVELAFMVANSSDYLDRVAFSRIFTGQEYTEQLTGVFYRVLPGDLSYSRTFNIFKGYSDDRYKSANVDNRVFVEETIQPMWEIDAVLPKINDGTLISVEYLYAEEDSNKLNNILNSSTNDKTYYLVAGTKAEKDAYKNNHNLYDAGTVKEFVIEMSDAASIKYVATVRSVFVGESVNISGSQVRPTIVFKIASNTLSTVFNFISGASFTNLDIVVRVENTNNNLSLSNKDYADFGVLANTVENVTIDNCTITLEFSGTSQKPTFDSKVPGTGADGTYNAVNSGLLFGSISNSTIKNSTFSVVVNSQEIVINNENIESLGLIAGSVYRTKFTDNTFHIKGNGNSVVKLTIEKISKRTSYIGGVIGTLNNSTYNNNRVKGSGTAVEYAQTIQVTDKTMGVYDPLVSANTQAMNKSISGLFGYAYNSNVKLSALSSSYFETMKLKYMHTSNVEVADIVNLGAVAGVSKNTKYVGIQLIDYIKEGYSETTLIEVDSIIELAELSVGAIIGRDLNASQVGELVDDSIIGNASKLLVVGKAKSMFVGGLVGKADESTKAYNAYNTADINVKNISVGTKTPVYEEDGITQKLDGNGQYVFTYEYVYTYVGGLLGSASGKATFEGVLSSGALTILGSSHRTVPETIYYAMGGLIGHISFSCDLSKFAVLSDFKFGSGFIGKLQNTYVSGIIGYNRGTFNGNNGYTYCMFNFDTKTASSYYTNVITSATTNNSVNTINNVFYAQEFIGNNYTTDSKFVGFAIGDIYNSVSYYAALHDISMTTKLANIKVVNSVGTEASANVFLPVVSSLRNVPIRVPVDNVSDGYSRFKVKSLIANADNTATYAGEKYAVVQSNMVIAEISQLQSDSYISGKTVYNGKVRVSLGHSPDSVEAGYLVDINKGVISNIYLATAKQNPTNASQMQELNVSLVDRNEGLITNVYVYERTKSQYGFARENSGRIYQSATANVYLGDQFEIYAFAMINTGHIYDCYSASAGYTENNNKTTDVYLVKDNGFNYLDPTEGTLLNCFYYIPEMIEFDNVQKGYYKKNVVKEAGVDVDKTIKGIVTSCDKKMIPTFTVARTSIWTTENDHAQIRGMKDIAGAMVMHIYYQTGTSLTGTSTDINYVTSFRSNMTTSNYLFTYKIHFYETTTPKYNVIRIVKGEDLVEYITSLATQNYYIPHNTVVAILNNIEVNPELLPKFSLNSSAMIVGLYHEVWELDGDDYTCTAVNNKPIIDFVKGDKKDMLVYNNQGVMANIIFRRVSIVYDEQDTFFAPIYFNNYGAKINGIQLGYRATGVEDDVGIKVWAPYCKYVIGFVAGNRGNISNIQLYDLNIDALNYYTIFIHTNYAGASGKYNLKIDNLTTYDRLYNGYRSCNS
ncbi:MAG: hypothetical protein E7354_02445 [Clostridiales bacterium]|nr:hypothetical protein [Clostridiales bacterium]